MKRTPSLAIRTRQKYSPSSSPSSRVSQGPAASVIFLLTSHVPVCIKMFSPILRISHSRGDRSHHSEDGLNSARHGLYMKCAQDPDSKVRGPTSPCMTGSICLAIL